MKKFLLIFSFLFALFFSFSVTTFAVSDTFTEVQYCDSDKGFSISEAERRIQVLWINQFYPDHKDICFTYEIGAVQEDNPDSLFICPKGYNVPYKNDKPTEISGQGCCPAGYGYFYDKKGSGTNFCLHDTSIAKDSPIRDTIDCSNNTYGAKCPYICEEDRTLPANSCGASILNQKFLNVYPRNTTYFFTAEKKYICEEPNCMSSQGQPLDDPGLRVPLSEYDIGYGKLSCDLDGGVIADKTCFRGAWYLTSDLEDWEGRLGEFLTCSEFYSTEEKQSCMDCYNDCPTENTCSYSSLGCIQTTQDGIIIRVFQIGLGVVGALAIARFIQAALLRQTADPSKIQESYDIITSIIIGIVVLLGSTVILRFIGVDILQMMPF